MNPKDQIPMPEESLEELDIDATESVDDFIKELEAKEKDLDITADYTIEIAESDVDLDDIPAFVQQELPSSPAPVGTAAPQAGMKTRVYELENEVAELKDRILSLRSERNEIQEKSDRRLKDFENYKYRMDRERRGSFIDQISNLAAAMLPVLDNLYRAIASVESTKVKKSDEFQQFYDGIALVNQQVNEIFSEMGVQPIVTVGEMFDPDLHEAVAAEESEDQPVNTIVAEMLRGYRIGNRVIRHSMVKVTTAPPKAKTDEPEASSDKDEQPEVSPESDSPEIEVSTPEAE